MSSGGGGGTSKTVTQNYSPEEAKRRAQVMDEARRIYKRQGKPGDYPGPEPVGADPATEQGQAMMLSAANQAQGMNPQMQEAMQFGLSDVLDVENNPQLQNAIRSAQRSVTQEYMDPNGVMSQIRSGALDAGQYGGSRQGIAEGIAAGRYANELGDISSTMMSDAYNRGLDTFGRTLGLAPQTMQALGTGGQFASAVGSQRENLAQALEGYEAAGREWDINAPWMNLENYANLVYGAGSSQSTSTATTQGPQRSPLQGAAGGAMAGWGAAGALGLSNPVGAAAGAILGALF